MDLSKVSIDEASRALLVALDYDPDLHTVEAVKEPAEGLRIYSPGHLCIRFLTWDQLEEPEMDRKWSAALKQVARKSVFNRKQRRGLQAQARAVLKARRTRLEAQRGDA